MASANAAILASNAIARRSASVASRSTLPRSATSSTASIMSSPSSSPPSSIGRPIASSSASLISSSWSSSHVRWMTTYYTPAHEYCTVDGKIATVGITDFAQSALGDIVFVDLPSIDDSFVAGDSFGSVESVKAASDVYAPVSGRVIEINTILGDEPGLVNTEAEGEAWFVKLELSGESEGEIGKLMSADEYKAHCEKEAH